jgi:xanthine dehydrogenase accessory factor
MAWWLERVARELEQGSLFAVATVVAGENVGAKRLIFPDGRAEGTLGAAPLDDSVSAETEHLFRQELSETLTSGTTEVFVEVFAPPPRLIIVGGVHTAIPLAQLAQLLGFHVTVVDGRGRFATRERFPDVDELIVEWPDQAIPRLRVDASTYVVILTHDPKFDLPALAALADKPARYVGAMGSRETRHRHMEQLRAQGLSSEFLNRVYGPVGLDLGARTPEEMALAIMAEITAVRYGHSGGHLKSTGGHR